MDSIQGVLLIPPDRGQILGRALWKPRYVVVGRRNAHKDLGNPSLSQIMTTSRIRDANPKGTPKSPAFTDEFFISIFKSKVRLAATEFSGYNLSLLTSQDDWEPSHQYPVSSVVDCQVQMVAHRKQGPVLPTLVITLNDKERKRRSSRAAGLITTKESSSATLWFRTPPDDHHLSLHEWARFILARKLPMSPDSPASPSFINPFAPRSESGEYFPRPGSGSATTRSTIHHKPANLPYSCARERDRPITFSPDSPSLRSKRSDISSPSSATYSQQYGAYSGHGYDQYTTVLPTDLPSPVGTVGEYKGEFIEGWTSAQGRSSTVSSPVRGRGSVSSQAQPVPGADSSSPPGPRETILDRAFQLRCIPGSENETPGEEKLTSLARFDALMREADEKRKQLDKEAQAEKDAMRSVWDMDDDTDDDDEDGEDVDGGDDGKDEEEDEDDDDGDEIDGSNDGENQAPRDFAHETDTDRQTLIPPSAQRALDFIASRHNSPRSPRSPVPGSPVNYSTPLASFSPVPPPPRPHTAHSKLRPSMAHRTHSQTQFLPQDRLDVPLSSSSGKTSEDGASRPSVEKRISSSSTKRLSFTEFTKRLSSTSSLLLVQTNASGGSSRGSSEFDQNQLPVPRGSSLNAKGVPPRPSDRDREDWEKRCAWRGSVGVGTGFSDGGFL